MMQFKMLFEDSQATENYLERHAVARSRIWILHMVKLFNGFENLCES